MSNRCDRIYFATKQIAIAQEGSSTYRAARGLQNFNFTSEVPLQEVFQIGMLSPRVLMEDLPDINMSTEKHLDGYPLIYHLATTAATSPTLAGRSQAQCKIGLSIFESTQEAATGTEEVVVEFTGCYYGNIRYSFSVDGMFTESVDFVSNDIIVSDDARILNTSEIARAAALSLPGQFTGDDDPLLNKREHMMFSYTNNSLDENGQILDADCTVLPSEVDGISDSGTNEIQSDGARASDLQSITVSASINRERKQALGSFEPVCQQIRFPVVVNTEITVQPRRSGLASMTAIGILNTGEGDCGDSVVRNLRNQTIRIAVCEGTRIYTGTKNKLRSQNYSGGDAGGADVTITYSYETRNDFVVLHPADPHSSGATWWSGRAAWLTN
jgi:hypothetical protein